MISNRYGKLEVVKRIGQHHKTGSWLCKCDCGNEIRARAYVLNKGLIKCCGCTLSKTPEYKNPEIKNGKLKFKIYSAEYLLEIKDGIINLNYHTNRFSKLFHLMSGISKHEISGVTIKNEKEQIHFLQLIGSIIENYVNREYYE